MALPPDMRLPYSRALYRGTQGEDVKALQRNLNAQNDYYEFCNEPYLPTTGYFGDQTIRMLKAFQKFCDLPPSGMYEEKTHDLMEWKNYNRLFWTDKANQERMRREEADRLFGERTW